MRKNIISLLFLTVYARQLFLQDQGLERPTNRGSLAWLEDNQFPDRKLQTQTAYQAYNPYRFRRILPDHLMCQHNPNLPRCREANMIRHNQQELTLLEVTDSVVEKPKTEVKAQLSQSTESSGPTIKENSEKDLRIARLELLILNLSKKLDAIANPGLKKEMLIYPTISNSSKSNQTEQETAKLQTQQKKSQNDTTNSTVGQNDTIIVKEHSLKDLIVIRSEALTAPQQQQQVMIASSAQTLIQDPHAHTQIKLFHHVDSSNPDQVNQMLGSYINDQIDMSTKAALASSKKNKVMQAVLPPVHLILKNIVKGITGKKKTARRYSGFNRGHSNLISRGGYRVNRPINSNVLQALAQAQGKAVAATIQQLHTSGGQ